MAIRGYILIDTEVGSARTVADALRSLKDPGTTIVAADGITGPHDVIVQFESPDMDEFGRCMNGAIQTIPGIKRTTTCLVIR